MLNRKKLVDDINASYLALSTALEDFTQEDLNRVPSGGKYSAGQLVHYALDCCSDLRYEPSTKADRSPDAKLEASKKALLRMEWAPGSHHPFPTFLKDTLLQRIKVASGYIKTMALLLDLEQLCTEREFMDLGYLTRFEWLSLSITFASHQAKRLRDIRTMLRTAI